MKSIAVLFVANMEHFPIKAGDVIRLYNGSTDLYRVLEVKTGARFSNPLNTSVSLTLEPAEIPSIEDFENDRNALGVINDQGHLYSSGEEDTREARRANPAR